jgi:hypothetical protein
MGTQTAIADAPRRHRWHVVTRVTFRFCFAYLGLYFLATQLSGGLFPLPNAVPPGLEMRAFLPVTTLETTLRAIIWT